MPSEMEMPEIPWHTIEENVQVLGKWLGWNDYFMQNEKTQLRIMFHGKAQKTPI